MTEDQSGVFQDNKANFIPSKTQNTPNNQNNQNTPNTPDILRPSRLDPDCVQKARETPEPIALKVILSWQKRRGIPESQRLELVKVFCAVHNLNLDSIELLDVLNVQAFSCDYIKEIGFCD